MTFEQFQVDHKTRDAVSHNFLIIGEASTHVAPQIRQSYSLPWDEMRGMRNIVAHHYFEVNARVVWETIQNDLPNLIEALLAIPGVQAPPSGN
jgi:uncharacterized protein with HEPN domain